MSSQTLTVRPVARPARPDRGPRRLLLAGALAGPVFAGSAIAQLLLREGFDLTRHPISLLSTGSYGWIQILTFVATGLGVVAMAAGMRRTVTGGTGRRWLPRLVGAFGVGLVVAGVFIADPEDGFPVGTPAGPVEAMSWHAVGHATAAAAAFTALAVACIVAAVRAGRQRRVGETVLHAVTALVLLVPMSPEHASIQLAITGLVAFTWTTVVAVRLRAGK